MISRREFVKSLPVTGSAFAVAGHMILDAGLARGQQMDPLKGHFHPNGKAPSKFTLEALKRAKAELPFADKQDLEEQKKGFIAPMKELKIKADAGHVAWDMERFQFLEKQEEFDTIHPSLLRQSVLNNNYGLYEVIPGIYQVRGFDLSDISFVRGKTGWIVFDPLVSAEVARAAWKLFQEHVGEKLPVSTVIYSHSHVDQGAVCAGLSRSRMCGRGRFRLSPRAISWCIRFPKTFMPAMR
jgi:alkyl sulfatase BDS1-like metallo-beta-lactamase superfamily hydrolase